VAVTLLEIDPELSDLAAQNIVRNGLDQRLAPSRWMSQRRPTISQPKASDPAQPIMS